MNNYLDKSGTVGARRLSENLRASAPLRETISAKGMKTILKTVACGAMVLAVSCAFAAAPAASAAKAKPAQTAAQKAAAEKAAKLAAEKAAAEAAKKAEKARQDAWKQLDKSAQELVRKDFKGGFANYWHDNIDAARALYETALTNEMFTNAQKIDALRQIAQTHLEATRDTKAALASMERAFKLADLTKEDKAHADAAMLSLLRAMRLAPPDPNSPEMKKAAYTALSLDEKADRARSLDDRYKAPSTESVRNYFFACLDAGYDEFFARVPAMLKEFDAKYPKSNYWRYAWEVANQWWNRQRPTKAQRDARFNASYVKMMECAPTNFAVSAEAFFGFTDGRAGFDEKRAVWAEKIVAQAAQPKAKVNPKSVAAAKKYLLFHKAGADKAKIVAACRAWLAEEKKQDDKAALAKLLEERARAQLKAGNEAVARALWDERLKIAPEKPQSKIDCPYWKDAPHDIRGIVESDFYKKAPKGLFTHKYGDNLEFLILTDSAITSRQMTTDKGEKFRPTEIFAFCDARGVHILLRAFQDNMDEVKLGNASVPGYESYLATGIDDPYHCLMLETQEGCAMDDGFVTQYDNGTGYRNLSSKRGNVQYQNLYLDDSAATLISVSWGGAPTAIPSRSPAWYFEAIHWAHGGLSWGGSKSVHWRSKCGELKFTGVDAEALAAIRRTVIRKARQTMGAEKSARSGGYIEQWMDPVQGDQEFYLAVVKPLVARIDADLAKVTKDSTPAEIEAVFATGSVDDAINIEYRLSELRTRWLERKMTE